MEGLVQFPKLRIWISNKRPLFCLFTLPRPYIPKKYSNKLKNKIDTEQNNKAEEKQQVKIWFSRKS
jgi:hypothetical protein